MKDHISDEQREALQQAVDAQRDRQQSGRGRSSEIREILEWQRRHGFRVADGRVHLRCHGDARELLLRGLVYFCGEMAEWLPEYDRVAEWLTDNQGRGLMLIGDCGRGKTLITQRILPMLFERGLLTDPDGRRLIYGTYTALDLLERFDEIAYGKLICIDDVGTEPKMKKFGVTHDYFAELADICERREKLLVCSTNLKVEQIVGGTDDEGHTWPARYDQRTFDRLRALTTRVFFTGPSLRG